MKKIVGVVIRIIILGILLMSALLIGTPISEGNIQIVYMLSGIFCVCYFLGWLFKKIRTRNNADIPKTKIIIDKMDIFVILLAFSSLIPILFRTYASLSSTVYIAQKYFCVLALYFIVKQECRKHPKYVPVIINFIIFTILILCVIGLDEIHGNYLKDFKSYLKYSYVEYDEVRICSLFSYPNTMAAVAGLGIFLCLGYTFKRKSIPAKIFYVLLALIMAITMFLTYSRLALLIFILVAVFYIAIVCKKYEIWKKITKKTVVALVALLVVVIVYIGIGLKVGDELVLEEDFQKIFYSVKPNTDYIFVFNMETTSYSEEAVIMKFTEKNEYFDDVNVTEEKVGNRRGETEITIHTRQFYGSYVFEY